MPKSRLPSAAYPNPAHASADVRFGLAEATPVRVAVYDMLGREVAVLAQAPMEAGLHTLRLDARTLPSGLYVVRLETPGRAESLRLALHQ